MTRRERNAAFDADPPPPVLISSAGAYLWSWYQSLSDAISRVRGGVCGRLPPSDIKAHFELAGLIVRSSEYAILRAMDRAFCDVMNEELQAYRDRVRDQQQQEIEKSRRTKRR